MTNSRSPVDVSARTTFTMPITFDVVAQRDDGISCVIVSMTACMDNASPHTFMFRDDMALDIQIDMCIDRVDDYVTSLSPRLIGSFATMLRDVITPMRVTT